MSEIVTIKGKSVIAIYESLNGSYWFITEKSHKQDSVINSQVFKDDQILFGYVRLAACPDCAEWGYISEAELNSIKPLVWKVPQMNWPVCPLVEVQPAKKKTEKAREERKILSLSKNMLIKLKGGVYENGMETNTFFN